MTYHPDCTLSTEILEQIADSGLDALPDAIRLLINAAMLLERQQFIGAGPYQRSPERQAHANGFKEKTVQTRIGALRLDVPQVREGGFTRRAWTKGPAPSARSSWRWPKCMSRASRPARWP